MEWFDFKKIKEQKIEEKYEEQLAKKREYYKKLQIITDKDREAYMEKARQILSGKSS